MGGRAMTGPTRRMTIVVLGSVLALAAGSCPLINDITGVTNAPEDTSQKTEVWMFIAKDARGTQEAKVTLRGCTASTCTGAILTSVSPHEWKTRFGTCELPWHLSGQVSGDLVSFTINGTGCEASLQGRALGGRLNGRFGTATATLDWSPMSWNGFTTLFGGRTQSFNGSADWSAIKCVTASDCSFPIP